MPLRFLALALAAVIGPRGATTQPPPQRVLTVEDIFALEALGATAVSPDGEWLAYVIKRPSGSASAFKLDFLGGGNVSDIWLVPTAGGAPRNITNGAADSTGYFAPLWSPDGKRLALFSTKGGGVHLWTWDRQTNRLQQHAPERGPATVQATAMAWIDNSRLVINMTRPGSLPLSYVVERLPAMRQMDAWPRAWAGQSTASVIDAGVPERAPPSPVSELMLVDIERTTSRVLVPGEVTSFVLSPDSRHLAIARRDQTYQPAAGDRFGIGITRDSVSIAVMVTDGSMLWPRVDGIGAVRPPGETPPMTWSDDGSALAVHAFAPGGASAVDHLFRLTMDGRRVDDLTGDSLDVAGATALWVSKNQLVFGARRRATSGARPRMDWWSSTSPTSREVRLLTASMSRVPARLWRTSDDASVFGTSSDALWRIPIAGGAPVSIRPDTMVKLTGVAMPNDPSTRARTLVLTATRGAVDEWHAFDVAAGRMNRLAGVRGDARAVADASSRNTWFFASDGDSGTVLVASHTESSGTPPATVASLNGFLRGITPGGKMKIDYRTTDGQPAVGWLILPPGYRVGTRYPMVVWVYAGSVMGPKAPGSTGVNRISAFNLQVAAAHGYVVLLPSMPLAPMPEEGPDWTPSDPFLDIPKGVLPAIDKVVELGIADSRRVGVMGQSYGGYSTMALVAQTDRFAAAVELAGPSNLVSLYGQFETRQALEDNRMEIAGRDVYYLNWSEAGQGRMGVPPWKDMQRYLRNSPITYADRIKTPLMLVQGDMDIIGLQQGQEMFTALYRQNKRVRFVRYWGEGHVLSGPANVRDFWMRTFDWFDTHFARAAKAQT